MQEQMDKVIDAMECLQKANDALFFVGGADEIAEKIDDIYSELSRLKRSVGR